MSEGAPDPRLVELLVRIAPIVEEYAYGMATSDWGKGGEGEKALVGALSGGGAGQLGKEEGMVLDIIAREHPGGRYLEEVFHRYRCEPRLSRVVLRGVLGRLEGMGLVSGKAKTGMSGWESRYFVYTGGWEECCPEEAIQFRNRAKDGGYSKYWCEWRGYRHGKYSCEHPKWEYEYRRRAYKDG